MPNALLVYPAFPPSYWGYKYALDFVGKKSSMPPLGLLTVAGMFPKEYTLRVVDMNVNPLTDDDLQWADVVFTSTMIVQKDSLQDVIERCNRAGIPIVAGGPHPTSFHEEINEPFSEGEGVNHFVLDEVEDIFPNFLQDLRNGNAQHIYRAPKKPDVTNTPLPRYDLINLHDYGSMALQFSRGCPFDCEFCDITKLFGRVPRTKPPEQMLTEFEMLYKLGWTGALFVVDDNFIGNKRDAMRLLPQVVKWQQEREYPFSLYTEATVNLVEIPNMLDGMRDAGFSMVFLGIESVSDEALLTTAKKQNTNKNESARSYLLRSIRTIQNNGLEVTGGFIIGLDGDTEFDSHIEFIQEAGIPMAMAGLLTVLKGTNLHHRLESENRLLEDSTGNNTDINLNFVPELPREHLISEYRRVVSTLYDPTLENYFERCLTLLKNLNPTDHNSQRVGKTELMAFAKSIQRQLFSKQGKAYFKFLATVAKNYPKMFGKAVRLAIHGYHFEKITSQTVAVDNFKRFLETEFDAFKETISRFARTQSDRIGEATAAELGALKETVSRLAKTQSDRLGEVRVHVQSLLNRVHTQYEQIHQDYRYSAEDSLQAFQKSVKNYLEQLFGSLPVGLEALDS